MSPVHLRDGMLVYSADGTKLGKIISCRADGFIVEKGLFLPKASQFQYEDVAELHNGDVYLTHGRTQLADRSWRSRAIEATPLRAQATDDGPYRGAPATAAAKPLTGSAENEPNEIRVRLAEEQITAEKRTRDLGEVRVHKRVVVEKRQITIPVMHEEVYVERVVVDAKSALQPAEGTFVESTVTIPLHDEEVRIFKRPVIREEVRVTRRALQEDRTTTTEIRKEELDIDQPKGVAEHLHMHRSP